MSIPTPTAYEVAVAIRDVLLATGFFRHVETDPAANITPKEYIGLTRTGTRHWGAVLEVGPAVRRADGRNLEEERTYFVSFFLTSGYVPAEPAGHGEATTSAYVARAMDEAAKALHAAPRLGFGLGGTSYPTATVRHRELQEPEGQTRLQGDLANVATVRGELVVTKRLC